VSLRFQACALAAAGVTLLIVMPTHGAEPGAKDGAKAPKTWSPPRTPDGQPDLQGYWTNGSYIPLERPKELGDKEFYTEAEAAAVEKKKLQDDHSQAADDIHYDNVIWQGDKYAKGSPSLRTSIVFDPPDGRLPPLSPQGQKHAAELKALVPHREAAESAEYRSLGERCITWGADGPPLLGSTYNANFQIVQSSTSVAILTEMIHSVRTIPLDGRPHLPASIHQLAGDSRGHWDGDTLVVETAGTNGKAWMDTNGHPVTDALKLTERFHRRDFGHLDLEITIDDPKAYTKPWTVKQVANLQPDTELLEYICEENNRDVGHFVGK
jgi:hypothetical protein